MCSRSLAAIQGSNPKEDMHVCLWWVLCCALRPSDHSSRKVLPSVCCLIERHREASTKRRPLPTRGSCTMEKKSPKYWSCRSFIKVGTHVMLYCRPWNNGVFLSSTSARVTLVPMKPWNIFINIILEELLCWILTSVQRERITWRSF